MQQSQHVATGPETGHQAGNRPESAATTLVAPHPQDNVVNEITEIAAALEQAKPLG